MLQSRFGILHTCQRSASILVRHRDAVIAELPQSKVKVPCRTDHCCGNLYAVVIYRVQQKTFRLVKVTPSISPHSVCCVAPFFPVCSVHCFTGSYCYISIAVEYRRFFFLSSNSYVRLYYHCANLLYGCITSKALALLLSGESPGICCNNGQVVLRPLTLPPNEFLQLLEGNAMQYHQFRHSTRKSNCQTNVSALCVEDGTLKRMFGPHFLAVQGRLVRTAYTKRATATSNLTCILWSTFPLQTISILSLSCIMFTMSKLLYLHH